jgi:hypothetical protein
MKIEFSGQAFGKILKSNLLKIRQVGVELLGADGQTDRQTDREVDRQTGTQTDRQADRHIDR